MNKFTFEDIVCAFAGIQQAAVLIQQLVSSGRCDEEAFNATINSLYSIDAPNVMSIYGGRQGLRLGLTTLKKTLSDDSKSIFEKQIARYVISMIQAERHLQSDSALRSNLQKKIRYVQNQAEFFNSTHPTVVNSLGKVYEDTIGKLKFKIGIIGKRELLTNPEVMGKIRALLLGGIRSAVLWQQVGGSRWQLIFQRRQYKKMLEQLVR